MNIKKRTVSLGPYSLDKMRSLARQGLIGRHHHISKAGGPFQTGAQFPELFQLEGHTPDKVNVPKKVLWHYTLSGSQQEKPAVEDQLVDLVGKGVVRPTDVVWHESVGDKWVTVSSVPQFAAAIPAAKVEVKEQIEELYFDDEDRRRRKRRRSHRRDDSEQQESGPKPFNAMGLAGFICSVVAIVLLTIPCFVFIVAAESLFWSFHIVIPFMIVALVGLVLSGIGLTRPPQGMATTGTVLGVIALTMGIVAFLGWVFLPHRIAMQRRTLIDSRIADIKLSEKHLKDSLTMYQNAMQAEGEPVEVFKRRQVILRRKVGKDINDLITAYNDHLTVTTETSEFPAAFDDLSLLQQSLKNVEETAEVVEEASLLDVFESANVNVLQLRDLMDTRNLYQRGDITLSQAEAKMTGL